MLPLAIIFSRQCSADIRWFCQFFPFWLCWPSPSSTFQSHQPTASFSMPPAMVPVTSFSMSGLPMQLLAGAMKWWVRNRGLPCSEFLKNPKIFRNFFSYYSDENFRSIRPWWLLHGPWDDRFGPAQKCGKKSKKKLKYKIHNNGMISNFLWGNNPLGFLRCAKTI